MNIPKNIQFEIAGINKISINENENLRWEDVNGGWCVERPMSGSDLAFLKTIIKLQKENEEFKQLRYIMNNPGEPFFVLLGRDPQAPALLRRWAYDRSQAEPEQVGKWQQAYDIADAMEQYKTQNPNYGMLPELCKETPYTISYHSKTLLKLAKNNLVDISITMTMNGQSVLIG